MDNDVQMISTAPNLTRIGSHFLLTVGVIFFLSATPAMANDSPMLIGKFDDWSAYEFGQGKEHICYALVQDTKAAKGVAEPHLMVTHRPGEKTANVVEADLGTDLPPNGIGNVTVGNATFAFFTKNQSAWAPDSDTDKMVVTTMVKAKSFAISVKPAKAVPIARTFPLTGFPKALAAIDKACKIKR